MQRPGKLVFSFSGVLVAETSSVQRTGRYTELRLYKVKSSYLLHITGASLIPGEEQHNRYIRAKDPHEVVRILRMRKAKPHSNVALDLLKLAKQNDPGFQQDWEGRYAGKTGGDNRRTEGREVPPVREES